MTRTWQELPTGGVAHGYDALVRSPVRAESDVVEGGWSGTGVVIRVHVCRNRFAQSGLDSTATLKQATT